MSQRSDESVGNSGGEAEPSGDLHPGDALGRFTIEAVIGQGGMGRVYRARDSALNRTVAIKLVPPELVAGKDTEHRFEREAQLLASLQHPHIATLFDFVTDGPCPFLAMELVEGQSLSELLREEPRLEPRPALEIASQVASALAAAHHAGVIHRDIKPDNIKLTPEGQVKVLDFGLARMTRDDGSTDTEAPTAILPTQPGTVMGTAPYMSPEQARGQSLDERTDIWSLGCVLFELLSGERAFAGPTATDTMAAVMKDEPNWSRLPEGLSPTVSRLLRRMLHKEPHGRLRDAGDLQLAIDDLLAEGLSEGGLLESQGVSTSSPTGAPARAADAREVPDRTHEISRHRSAPWLLLAAALGLVLGTLLGATLLRRSEGADPAPVRRLVVPLEGSLEGNGRTTMALSPDGSQLAYIAVDETGRRNIWLRPLDGFEARPLDAPGAFSLFWSSDSRQIGYAEGLSLRRVPLDGGASSEITEIIDFMGGDWGTDGSVLFSDNRGLNRVDASGQLDTLMSGAMDRLWPQRLESGAILLTRVTDWGNQKVVHFSVGGDETVLVDNAFFGRLIDDEVLLFGRSGALYAANLDLATLEVGEPLLVLDQLLTTDIFGGAQFSVSSDGTLAWVPARSGDRRVMAIDPEGNIEPLGEDLGAQFMPRASPDGRYVTLSVLSDGDYDIWRIDLERETSESWITEGSTPALVWSPRGDRVAYSSWREEVGGLYLRTVDSSEETLLYSYGEHEYGYPISWGTDDRILLSFFSAGSTEDVVAISPEDGTLVPWLAGSEASEQGATLSPDGHLLAWTVGGALASDAGLFVRLAGSEPGSPMLVANGGRMPRWSPDGRWLYFLTGEGSRRMMAIEVGDAADGRPPSLSEPRFLFEEEFGGSIGYGLHRYDVLPDGRFVYVTPALQAEPQIRVQLGWLDEVKRRLSEP